MVGSEPVLRQAALQGKPVRRMIRRAGEAETGERVSQCMGKPYRNNGADCRLALWGRNPNGRKPVFCGVPVAPLARLAPDLSPGEAREAG